VREPAVPALQTQKPQTVTYYDANGKPISKSVAKPARFPKRSEDGAAKAAPSPARRFPAVPRLSDPVLSNPSLPASASVSPTVSVPPPAIKPVQTPNAAPVEKPAAKPAAKPVARPTIKPITAEGLTGSIPQKATLIPAKKGLSPSDQALSDLESKLAQPPVIATAGKRGAAPEGNKANTRISLNRLPGNSPSHLSGKGAASASPVPAVQSKTPAASFPPINGGSLTRIPRAPSGRIILPTRAGVEPTPSATPVTDALPAKKQVPATPHLDANLQVLRAALNSCAIDFDSSSTSISPDQAWKLRKAAAQILQSGKGATIRLVGRGGKVGQTTDMSQSLMRTLAVQKELVAMGVSRQQLKVEYVAPLENAAALPADASEHSVQFIVEQN